MVQVTFVVALVSFCFGLVHSAPVALKPRAFELLEWAFFAIETNNMLTTRRAATLISKSPMVLLAKRPQRPMPSLLASPTFPSIDEGRL